MKYYLILILILIVLIYVFKNYIYSLFDLIEDSIRVNSDLHKLNRIDNPIITFYGSAYIPKTDKYYKDAFELSNKLSKKGFIIMTGGGPSIMESANCGAKQNSKNNEITSISSSTHHFSKYEKLNDCSQLAMLHDRLWGRKTILIDKSEAFIVFPGGIGTMDELFNTLTLMITKQISEKRIILYDNNYWSEILIWIKKAIKAGTISKRVMDLIIVKDTVDDIVKIFEN